LEVEEIFAVEGPGAWAWVPGLTERLNDEARRSRLLESIRRVECEPSILGARSHLFAVGRRV
jgi:hypothetical protein